MKSFCDCRLPGVKVASLYMISLYTSSTVLKSRYVNNALDSWALFYYWQIQSCSAISDFTGHIFRFFKTKCVKKVQFIFSSYDIQLNLINSKSSGLEFLFRIISISNYRELDIKIYNP